MHIGHNGYGSERVRVSGRGGIGCRLLVALAARVNKRDAHLDHASVSIAAGCDCSYADIALVCARM